MADYTVGEMGEPLSQLTDLMRTTNTAQEGPTA
jgi:hypothetical protein